MKMSRQELGNIIESFLSPKDGYYLFDNAYEILDDAKSKAFFDSIAKQSQSIIGSWIENSNDCDKLSRLTAIVASVANSRKRKGSGIAFGIMAFLPDGEKVYHSVNVLFTKVRGQKSIRCRIYDPTDMSEKLLSTSEKRTVRGIAI